MLKQIIKAAKKIAKLEGRGPELAALRGALRVNSRKSCGARLRCSTLKIEMVDGEPVFEPGLTESVSPVLFSIGFLNTKNRGFIKILCSRMSVNKANAAHLLRDQIGAHKVEEH